jgi:hypothetical protein
LEWALDKGLRELITDVEVDLVALAAGKGFLEVVKWLREKGWAWEEEAMRTAIRSGHLDLLRWAKEVGLFIPEDLDCRIITDFVEAGNLDLLRWLVRENGREINFLDYGPVAARQGHLHVLKWLWEENQAEDKEERVRRDKEEREEGREEGDGASEEGEDRYIACVDFLDQRGFLEDTRYFCQHAAVHGRFEVVKRLLEGKGEVDSLMGKIFCANVAKWGDLEAMKWVRERGCEWDYRVYVQAIREGKLEIMKWAKEEGCPWNSGVLKILFPRLGPSLEQKKERLPEILEWIHEEGLLESPGILIHTSFRDGMIDVLDWMVEKYGASGVLNLLTPEISTIVARSGNLHVLEWLKNLGYEFAPLPVFFSAGVYGHVRVLKWAKKNVLWLEMPVVGDIITQWKNWRMLDLNVLRWFHENGMPVTTVDLVEIIKTSPGNYYKWKMVRWGIRAGIEVNLELAELITDAKTKALCEKIRSSKK